MHADQWDSILRFYAFLHKFMPGTYFNLEFKGNVQAIIFEYRAYEKTDVRIEIPRKPIVYESPHQVVVNMVHVRCEICNEHIIMLESKDGTITEERGDPFQEDQDLRICCFCIQEPEVLQKYLQNNIKRLLPQELE